MICALISPGRSSNRTRKSCLPSTICWRISGTQRGHNESVCRGQPRGGFDFSWDLSSGLSDHLGVKDGFSGTSWLLRQNICHAPLAAIDIALSRYLMGLCICLDGRCLGTRRCAGHNFVYMPERTILKNAVHIHQIALRVSVFP